MILVTFPANEGEKVLSRIIVGYNLEEMKAKYPRHSFLIPQPKLEHINNEINSVGKHCEEFLCKRGNGDSLSLLVDELSKGRQLITISHHFSDGGYISSTYEAVEKEIKPISSRRMSEPAAAMLGVMISPFSFFIMYIIGKFIPKAHGNKKA